MIIEDTSRLYADQMTYYRTVYANSPRWNGSESLDGKTIVVYCEQGLGDQLQFLRYVPVLLERYPTARVVLHCSEPLHGLLREHAKFPCCILDRDCEDVPPHDCHIPSLSLPFALQTAEADEHYLRDLPGPFDEAITSLPGLKVGVAWEGNPEHSNNDERSCPLKHFAAIEGASLVCLQHRFHNPEYLADAQAVDLYTVSGLVGMLGVARAMKAVDCVVSVDTAILHLAGLLGIPAFGLLSHQHDARWDVMKWYKSVRLFTQPEPGNWPSVLESVAGQVSLLSRP